MTVTNENAVKDVVRVATTANITLSAEQTIDGIAVVSGDRVLVKNQSTAAENGIWIADADSWVRADDFINGEPVQVVTGTTIPVAVGTVNGNTSWEVTNTGDIIVGFTSLTFKAVTGAVEAIGVEETAPDGTETWAINDSGTDKYISLNTVEDFVNTRLETVNTITGNTTLTSTYRKVLCNSSTAAANPTLPLTTAGSTGEDLILANIDGTNGVAVIPSGNNTIGTLNSTSWDLSEGETLHIFNGGAYNWVVE